MYNDNGIIIKFEELEDSKKLIKCLKKSKIPIYNCVYS